MQWKVSKSDQHVQLEHVILETGRIATVAAFLISGIIAFCVHGPIITRVTLGQVVVELAPHHWNVATIAIAGVVLVNEIIEIEPERQAKGVDTVIYSQRIRRLLNLYN